MRKLWSLLRAPLAPCLFAVVGIAGLSGAAGLAGPCLAATQEAPPPRGASQLSLVAEARPGGTADNGRGAVQPQSQEPGQGLQREEQGLQRGREKDGVWSFAVSGDSRDCGDLVMPKIAAALRAHGAGGAGAPFAFYWHLGDFRRLSDFDCDIATRAHPNLDCSRHPLAGLGLFEMAGYLATAWDDFVKQQIEPFGSLPVYLAFGNHELYASRTRDDLRHRFARWLTEEPIHSQRLEDGSRGTGDKKGISSIEGTTYYHFIFRGVDFVTLDNADESGFSAAQLLWLREVLDADAHDPSVHAIVAGMHEALPFSSQREHAMDDTCQQTCSGQQAYDLLFRAQGLGLAEELQKHVYLFASHAHLFDHDVFAGQPEHWGQVLPGWIVGTAGAEQYLNDRAAPPPSGAPNPGTSSTLSTASPSSTSATPATPSTPARTRVQYGYLEVAVSPDGTLTPVFHEVTREDPPAAAGPGAAELTRFCFEKNLRRRGAPRPHSPCACGAAN